MIYTIQSKQTAHPNVECKTFDEAECACAAVVLLNVCNDASPSPFSTNADLGYQTAKSKHLTSPAKLPQAEQILAIHALVIEAFRGSPGAHINLNVSNEDLLGRENNLFVAHHVP
ncbi:hypothetical protein MAM1_0159c06883 [Mucor ambiguus]|uniref:Uncharacterized protein n=1 Tax=Mucor ambiguus TaxID=91626 RepID=A0A0C9MA70_9FUNG|nr:hypothetical protein MAM1_0159c06883 [Mucor ambiguus]